MQMCSNDGVNWLHYVLEYGVHFLLVCGILLHYFSIFITEDTDTAFLSEPINGIRQINAVGKQICRIADIPARQKLGTS
jgi:hypothetical protein